MYVPKHFAVSDVDEIKRFAESVRLGALVTHHGDGFFATHVPWLFEGDIAPGATMVCHVARANPHWTKLADRPEALVIFSGPNAYVTPSWYPSRAEHGRAVPTWAYQAVHVSGCVEIFEDARSLEGVVRRLSDVMENPRPSPWAIDDAPRDYIDMLLGAIVGIRLTISKVEAKYKLDQNKRPDDSAGAAAGLAAEGTDAGRALADRMQADKSSAD
jgi:transcriptional regulator